jgi:hypothetical protein
MEASMAHPRITVVLLGVLVVALLVGCRNEPSFTLAPVEGTVTKGGKPLAGVIVEFYGDPDFGTVGPRSTSAPTDEAGHYKLHTDRNGDGAVVGHHRVCVLDTQAMGDAIRRNLARDGERRLPKELAEKLKLPAGGASRVKASFGRLNETSLRAEVLPGSQVIDFKVE